MIIYLIIVILLFASELIYFRIADHYNIIDHPNERSSHTAVTLRGGGMIFVLAAIFAVIMHPLYWLPVLGIVIIGVISFLDDVLTLSSRVRLIFHIAAVSIMFYYLGIFSLTTFYVCALLYIMAIGVINMYNFMDGINGITGAYSVVVLAGLQYVNLYKIPFIDAAIIWLPLLACLIFLVFNFRKKAKCFAGDVGSVTIAFWIIFLLMKLIYTTGNWVYILFLVVYGVDSVMTIAHRLIRKENIFKAHRLHFYQVLANEQKVPHLRVAAGYAVVQGVIIIAITTNAGLPALTFFLSTALPLMAIYILLKPRLMRV
ncbi:MAG TPA: glycosyltransferase family 4 protein [Mucilaginibacter sp.]|nr:glycosyltransferase family 4 protein [Mucilaginibacter sp.]